ncbi:MAG: phenylalanine--tRNA ligase subunit beta [Clostridia bacterium]|nr:phenylalanine--tRNA ligase subunit beta [Clostridia bacterium]
MKLPISWLKEYVDIDVSIKELETKLFSSGFEVEEVLDLGKEISRCVVGVITSIEKHQDSDHLQICKLDCGKYGENIQIVTGASNVFVGAVVPVALDGATLKNGIKIKSGKLRGVASNGMLCSGEELGIDDNFFAGASVYGILILPENTPKGADIKDIVGLNDFVFDISITANRPDCQSILGMAREVSAILKKPLKMPSIFFVENEENEKKLTVEVLDNELCPRYIAHLVENIKIKDSPIFIKRRLLLCGINPINTIVDITNYVLLEMGQPMHAFDFQKLEGQKIVIRRAKENEKISTLDKKEFALNDKNLVICDSKKPVALAGIMGGLDSGITETTTEIVFESAKFTRENIRKTSRALGQSSDSSHRFEKGVDEFTTEMAMKRALNLINLLDCGKITNIHFDSRKQEKPLQKISTSFSKINKLLGIDISKETIIDILQRLNFEITSNPLKDEFVAIVPQYREDLTGYPDLAEEIIRIYGYDHITPTLLENTQITKGGLSQSQKDEFKAKNALVNQGFCEIITYSFFGEKDIDLFKFEKDAFERKFIRLQNPLTEDIEIMKTTLAPSTLRIIEKNIKKSVEEGRFFELANIYIPKELPLVDFPIERKTLSLGAFGKDESFFSIKGALESFAENFNLKFRFEPTNKPFLHPYVSANILLEEKVIGFVGQVGYDILEELSIDKNVFIAELNFEEFYQKYNPHYHYKPVSKHLEIKRDLALVVKEEITSGEIENIIFASSKKISNVVLFDIYKGEQIENGNKSMAYNITFAPDENPITHEEVDKYIEKILKNLKEKLSIELR